MNASLCNCLKSGLFVFHSGYFCNVKYINMVVLLLPAAAMWDWMTEADVRSRFPASRLTSCQPDVTQLLAAWKTLNWCDPRTSSWDVEPPLLRRHRGKWWRHAVTVMVLSVHLSLTHVVRSVSAGALGQLYLQPLRRNVRGKKHEIPAERCTKRPKVLDANWSANSEIAQVSVRATVGKKKMNTEYKVFD